MPLKQDLSSEPGLKRQLPANLTHPVLLTNPTHPVHRIDEEASAATDANSATIVQLIVPTK
jgi:hypothetical protein